MAKKIVITIEHALKLKYGVNLIELKKIFNTLVVADKARDIDTEFIFIDDPATASKYGYPANLPLDEKACKDIVDQLHWKENPAYTVIFGAQDVFPYQQLVNQLYQAGNTGSDPDQFIPSDLPYACDSPYSTDCNSFTNPTRVVGRIPDLPLDAGIPGEGDLEYVRTIFDHIISATPASLSQVSDYFSLSAHVWTGSTQTSLRNMFGNSMNMKVSSPNLKGSYNNTDLSKLVHFHNLHGSLGKDLYYGQMGSNYPPALHTTDLTGRVTKGAFVAAECCYGAQLLSTQNGISIASSYLLNNASVFMGSSTIAYGPAEGQGLADLICQYFIINVAKGLSSGNALLEARQKFLTVSGPVIDFHELKTLAQFSILGDPSIHPVESIVPKEVMSTIEDRRQTSYMKGINLGRTIPNTQKISESTSVNPGKDFPALFNIIDFGEATAKAVFEVDDGLDTDFLVKHNYNPPPDAGKQKVRYHVFQKGNVAHDGIHDLHALVVKEREHQVLGYREYISK